MSDRLSSPLEPSSPSALPASSLLDGRTGVVTGAAVGIGSGIAKALAYHGARLVLVDVDQEELEATAGRIVEAGGHRPESVVADVTEKGSLDRIVRAASDHGGATVLVNNVGDYRPSGMFMNDDPANWERMYALNFGHVLGVTHALLPHMVEVGRGAILNVSSVEGFRGIPRNAVYGALKAAVVAFTASLAAEVGQFGIRVNCIAPDLTDTPQTPMWQMTETRYADHVAKWVPVGRFGSPRDHGDAAVFLLSDQSAFVTGECLRVDGGTLAAAGWFRRDAERFTNMPRPLR